jgi:hypothetical protein
VVKLNVPFVDVQGTEKFTWGVRRTSSTMKNKSLHTMVCSGDAFYCPDPVYMTLFQEWFVRQLKCVNVHDMRFQDVASIPLPEYLNEVLPDMVVGHVQHFARTK